MPERLMQFFVYAHLKPELQPMAHRFQEMAQWLIEALPKNSERTVCLRKLLEARDVAIRSAIYQELKP